MSPANPPAYDAVKEPTNDLVAGIEDVGKLSKSISDRFNSLIINISVVERPNDGGLYEKLDSCRILYNGLVSSARFIATDARAKALDRFNVIAGKIDQIADTDVVASLNFISQRLPTNVGISKDGQTFSNDLHTEMNAAIQSLDFKIKGIQTNANEDVTNAENEVAKARNQLSASKENYRKKIPSALRELGINENSPKIIVLSILAPMEFILYILSFRSAPSITDELDKASRKITHDEEILATAHKNLDIALSALKPEEDKTRMNALGMLRTLLTDIEEVGPKLEIFNKIYEVVQKDIEQYVGFLSGPDAKDTVKRQESVQQVTKSMKLFNELSTGLHKFSVLF